MNKATQAASNPAQRFTLEQVAALRTEGFMELYRIRREAMGRVEKEAQEALHLAQVTKEVPAWFSSSFPDGIDLKAPGFWDALRALLVARTAALMEAREIAPGITGASLAAHVVADIQAIAREGWEGLNTLRLSLAGGAANV